ncbi:hypothetical protein TNCV_982101 [Trichonephila clavipes]|nr:hypothetical protein TNCV_982101 [Trichonephila clavipes]
MDLNGDFEWVCSTITLQNIYGRAPTIILLMMRPSRLFVKIRCHAVPSTRKRSAKLLGRLDASFPESADVSCRGRYEVPEAPLKLVALSENMVGFPRLDMKRRNAAKRASAERSKQPQGAQPFFEAKQVGHLDKSLSDYSSARKGIRISSAECSIREVDKSIDGKRGIKNPDLATVAQTTTVYELLALRKLQYLVAQSAGIFLTLHMMPGCFRKSFFEFLEIRLATKISICTGSDFSQSKTIWESERKK